MMGKAIQQRGRHRASRIHWANSLKLKLVVMVTLVYPYSLLRR